MQVKDSSSHCDLVWEDERVPVVEVHPLGFALSDGEMQLSVRGDWTVARAADIAQAIEELFRSASSTHTMRIDATDIETLDTFGACLIKRLVDRASARGYRVNLTGSQ